MDKQVVWKVGLTTACVFVVSFCVAHAQQPGPDPASLQVLQASLAAVSGGRAPVSIQATGTYTRMSIDPPVSYPLHVSVLAPGKIRREVDAPNGTYTTIVNGAGGWAIVPGQKATALSVGATAGRGTEEFPILAIADALANGPRVPTLIGSEVIDGKSTDHISLRRIHGGNVSADFEEKFENATRVEISLDQTTHLPVRVRYYEHSADWRVDQAVDLVLTDYQNVDGVMFPFTISRYIAGTKLTEIKYTSVQFNLPLADSLFVPEVSQ